MATRLVPPRKAFVAGLAAHGQHAGGLDGSEAVPHRRYWIQGIVVRSEAASAWLDDGSGTIEAVGLMAPLEPGAIVMAVGPLQAATGEGPPRLVAQTIIKLDQAEREPMWWLEVLAAEHSSPTMG